MITKCFHDWQRLDTNVHWCPKCGMAKVRTFPRNEDDTHDLIVWTYYQVGVGQTNSMVEVKKEEMKMTECKHEWFEIPSTSGFLQCSDWCIECGTIRYKSDEHHKNWTYKIPNSIKSAQQDDLCDACSLDPGYCPFDPKGKTASCAGYKA